MSETLNSSAATLQLVDEAADDCCEGCDYQPELKRTLGSFQVFAISFASMSVAIGIFSTYDDMLSTARPFVTGIEVLAPRSTGAVVTLGDSITDGYQQPAPTGAEAQDSLDADGRWPDVLARRLLAANRPLSVLNAGIAGNAVTQDGTALGADVFGPAALHRLDGDVFNQAGVMTVILLEGINDLAEPPVSTVDQLLDGYRQLIGALHSRGLRVLQGTITPTGGLDGAPADLDAQRQAVNTWIREKSPADGVIDFDAVVRDPADPARINPVFDGGDHLHFNLAGYLAMGDAIPLELLANPACS